MASIKQVDSLLDLNGARHTQSTHADLPQGSRKARLPSATAAKWGPSRTVSEILLEDCIFLRGTSRLVAKVAMHLPKPAGGVMGIAGMRLESLHVSRYQVSKVLHKKIARMDWSLGISQILSGT